MTNESTQISNNYLRACLRALYLPYRSQITKPITFRKKCRLEIPPPAPSFPPERQRFRPRISLRCSPELKERQRFRFENVSIRRPPPPFLPPMHPITCFRPFYISLASPFAPRERRNTLFTATECPCPVFYPVYRERARGEKRWKRERERTRYLSGDDIAIACQSWPRHGEHGEEFTIPSSRVASAVSIFISN